MTAYIKANDSWVAAKRPYVKRSNVWTPAESMWVKRSGVWTMAYEYDVTPSSPPELSLQIIDNRYIKVGARLPGTLVDPDLAMIRVLASRTAMPTTQFGSGYIYDATNGYPDEAWSDWYYNGSNPKAKAADHGDNTDEFDYKFYPVNPTDSTNLPGGQWYYFAAWSLDMNGNWSVGTFSRIWMPKNGTPADKIIVKEGNFQANDAGSIGVNGGGYAPGDMVMRDSPRSNGIWIHGPKITDAVGEQGPPTIRSAKIRVTRGNDTGQPTANVRLFWHVYGSADKLPLPDSAMNDITNLGTINKGETKWFDIPASYYPHFNTEIKGFGLVYGIQASDYLVVSGLGTDLRCGEVNVVWEEAL